MAVPPLAVIFRSVRFPTDPPSTPTEPTVSPTPIALPALPPLLTSPMETAPPLAEAVATPPLPAEAISPEPSSPPPKNLSCSRDWAAASAAARTPAAAPIAAAFTRRLIVLPLSVHAGHIVRHPSLPVGVPVDGHEDGSIPLWHSLRVSGRL